MDLSHWPSTRALVSGLAAASAGAASYALFASRPPMQVLRGTHPIDAWVPPHYQASVFPAFGAFVGSLAIDLLLGDARKSWVPRAVLLGTTSGLSLLRLRGDVSLSGHATFLTAMLIYEQLVAPRERSPFGRALALGGLGVTAAYKLGPWRDARGFVSSVAVGAALAALTAAGRRVRR